MLTFAKLAEINNQRCKHWHGPNGINDWSPSDWAVAMAGEAGEVCDAVKKYNRIRDSIANNSDLNTYEKATAAIGEELADTVIYCDLLAQRLGIDLADEIIDKFNKVSDKYGFSEKL